jgi:hypothetical protein
VSEFTHGVLLLLAAALTVILVQHGWPGVKAKLSAVFLGQPRPDLLRS